MRSTLPNYSTWQVRPHLVSPLKAVKMSDSDSSTDPEDFEYIPEGL